MNVKMYIFMKFNIKDSAYLFYLQKQNTVCEKLNKKFNYKYACCVSLPFKSIYYCENFDTMGFFFNNNNNWDTKI